MKKSTTGDDRTRREHLQAIGLLGAVGLGTTGAVQVTKAHLNSGDEHSGETLYSPPKGAPAPGAMYPRVERLEYSPGGNETLLATFEYYPSMSGGAEPYFPIYRSTNGGQTWSKFSEIHDQSGKDWGLRYQPTLYELPAETGPWPAGTVLAAGNAIPILDDPDNVADGEIGELGDSSIDLYASTDHGESWEYVSTVATGGPAVPHAGNSPVWEPELQLDADGNLVCYFADERQADDDDYNQLVGLKASSDGGQTWGDEEFVTAIPNGADRPGMPVVVELPNGTYMAVYEVVGSDNVNGEVRVKTSPDGRDWGDPTDLGQQVVTDDGRRFINGPYITWTPRGGPDGTILVSGKQLVDGNRNLADGNGEVVLANTNLDGSGNWTPVKASLSFETESELGGRIFAGWTTPILPSANGKHLLQMTSTAMNEDLCEIQYAECPLKLNKL
ncbi:sialidase family protein [Natrinema sp. SYSU A 869]|uniref:sialidase family protein n=1 Tax=Natrinema sp. SYSU A 869 TaxID=2871694 RepID=UPI001CA3ADBA|nr:sialidase family protein [Natrinema sp. SYSU A 869]